METAIWIAVALATAALVWATATYHQRIIDNREIPGQEHEGTD
jgi:hypothetical protein